MRLICEFASRVERSELAQLRHDVRGVQDVAGNEGLVLVIDELFSLAVRSGATTAVTRLFDGDGETTVRIATGAPVALAPDAGSITELLLRHIAMQWGRRSTGAGTEWWATVK